jgi:hypothetical protein
MTEIFLGKFEKSEEARSMACLTGPKSEEARASVPHGCAAFEIYGSGSVSFRHFRATE